MTRNASYFRIGLGLVACFVFVAISYVISTQTTVDWFSRSGTVMCLIAAAANFGLVNIHQSDLAKIIRDQDHSAQEKAEAILKPPKAYTRLSWLSYVTGVLGTAIWGYGDPLLWPAPAACGRRESSQAERAKAALNGRLAAPLEGVAGASGGSDGPTRRENR